MSEDVEFTGCKFDLGARLAALAYHIREWRTCDSVDADTVEEAIGEIGRLRAELADLRLELISALAPVSE